MKKHTPTTDDLRDIYVDYVADVVDLPHETLAEEFDRWLNKVKAEAWYEGQEAGITDDLGDWEVAPSITANPYTEKEN